MELKVNDSIFFKAQTEMMGMKRKYLSKDVNGSEQCIPFGGMQMTFKIKTCEMVAKKERLARREKEHLTERKEIRRGIRGITKMLKKPPMWEGSRLKRLAE